MNGRGLVWLRDDSPALAPAPDYVGRHHIPGDGVTTLRLMDVDGSGDVVGVRYVEDYHVTGEVA